MAESQKVNEEKSYSIVLMNKIRLKHLSCADQYRSLRLERPLSATIISDGKNGNIASCL